MIDAVSRGGEGRDPFARPIRHFSYQVLQPFALQGAFLEEGKEEFACFDVSLRMPGSPGTRFTPYSGYLFRESVSFGRRIAMEVKDAEKMKRMEKITT